MVRTCCVKSCGERYSSATNVSFHQFPKDPVLREQWIQRTNARSSNARVCSKHFSDDCFVQSPWSTRRGLKSDALPNVLNVEPKSEPGISSKISSKKRKAYVGDFKHLDIDNDKENYVDIVNATITKKNKVIKALLQKNKRLERKLKDLHTLIDELRSNEIITEDAFILLWESLRHSLGVKQTKHGVTESRRSEEKEKSVSS